MTIAGSGGSVPACVTGGDGFDDDDDDDAPGAVFSLPAWTASLLATVSAPALAPEAMSLLASGTAAFLTESAPVSSAAAAAVAVP